MPKNKKMFLIVALALGVLIISGLIIGSVIKKAEDENISYEVNVKACEAFLNYSYQNWSESMTREDFEKNLLELRLLEVYGGTPEYKVLLSAVLADYENGLNGIGSGPVAAMEDLIDWCRPFSSD